MIKVDTPLFKAMGTIRILRKDGSVKSELKITDFRPGDKRHPKEEAKKHED